MINLIILIWKVGVEEEGWIWVRGLGEVRGVVGVGSESEVDVKRVSLVRF